MTLPSKAIDIDAYFLNFLRPNAAIPISPLPNSIIVAGSGTGDEPDVYDPLPPKETLLPTPAINIPPTVVFSPY